MKKIIQTSKAPAPIGPYNQAILSGNTLYTSGQIAIDPSTGKLKTATIEEETTLVNLPVGAKNDNFIEVIGKGNAGRRGGIRGNLHVNMSVNLPDGVTRKGNDLYIDHDITISEAVLGTIIKVDGPKKNG